MQNAPNGHFTTISVSSERDIIPIKTQSIFHHTPALWIRGGALIEKSQAILGNLHVGEFMFGNISSDVCIIDTIHELTQGHGIGVYGNIYLEQGSELIGKIHADTINNAPFSQHLRGNLIGDVLTWTGTEYCPAPIQFPITVASFAIGDIFYASTTTTLSQLNIGSSGQVLTIVAGIPSWQTNTKNIINAWFKTINNPILFCHNIMTIDTLGYQIGTTSISVMKTGTYLMSMSCYSATNPPSSIQMYRNGFSLFILPSSFSIAINVTAGDIFSVITKSELPNGGCLTFIEQ